MPDEFLLGGKLAIDLSEVEALPGELEKAIAGTGVKRTNLEIGLEDGQAKTQLSDLQKQVTTLGKTVAKPTLTIDSAPAQEALSTVRSDVDKTVDKVKAAKAQLSAGSGSGGAGGLLDTDTLMSSLMMMGMGGVGGAGAKSVLTGDFTAAMQESRMESNLGRQFGAGGDQMTQFGKQLSSSTKFSPTDILQTEANLQAMGDQFGITDDQIKQMTTAITGLAHTSALPQYMDNLEAVTTSLEQGLNGNARGMKLLGIQVSDTYMKTEFMNGALGKTWDKMDMGTQMQYRFQAIMDQVGDRMNAASADTGSLAYRMRSAQEAIHEAEIGVGEGLIPVVRTFASIISTIPKPALEAIGVLAALAGSVAAIAMPAMGGRMIYKKIRTSLQNRAGAAGEEAGTAEEAAATEAGGAQVAAAEETAAGEIATAGTTGSTEIATAATTGSGEIAAAQTAGSTELAATMTAGAEALAAAAAERATVEGTGAAEIEAAMASVAAEITAGGWEIAGAETAAAAEISAGGAAGGLAGLFGRMAGVIPGCTTGLVSMSTALLAIPAALAIGLGAYLKHIAGQTDQATTQENNLTGEGIELEQIKTAKLTGMGDANDPRQAQYVVASARYIGNQMAYFNAAGQRLSSRVEAWQDKRAANSDNAKAFEAWKASYQSPNVTVTIQDKTSGGVKATDVGSYASTIH